MNAATAPAAQALEVDSGQLAQFVEALFRYAEPGGYVSLRSFVGTNIHKISFAQIPATGLAGVTAKAVDHAVAAALAPGDVVFCPPVAVFNNPSRSREDDVAEGVALSIECDSNPLAIRETLEGLLGPATVIVASGGRWQNPETGELEAKLHLHWRLSEPTRETVDHARLKDARRRATALTGADASNVPLVHPIRWPGSWHRKGAPVLARIVALNDTEIDLADALELLPSLKPAKPKLGLVVDGEEDWQSLYAAVLTSDDYHGPLRNLAAKKIAAGMRPGAVVNDLRALMNNSSGPRDERWQQRYDDIRRAVRTAQEKFAPNENGEADVSPVEPVDLWARYEAPALPQGLLPGVIERFAVRHGEIMGADPAGLAMAALTVCAAAIPDSIAVQVKRNDPTWRESTRLWVGLVGPPSRKKSPIFNAAMRPLRRLDSILMRVFLDKLEAYEALPAGEKKTAERPRQHRLLISDATIEAAQEVLRDSPDGLLSEQDELSGWFGSMDKYAPGKGSQADRAFWLKAFNGGTYNLNRIGRGASQIPNLSVSLLGGVQPEPIRKLANDTVDDGLIQRLLPVILRPSKVGRDVPADNVVEQYERLIERLNLMRPAMRAISGSDHDRPQPVRFDDRARAVRERLEHEHLELVSALEVASPKLAAHFGKYDGLFARLCLLWHCIDNADALHPPAEIPETTATRVAAFMEQFIRPSAIAFYAGLLGFSATHETLMGIAALIVSKQLELVDARTIQQAGGDLKSLTADEARQLCERLESFGWLERTDPPVKSHTPRWLVNPAVHELFAERGRKEAERRDRARDALQEALKRPVVDSCSLRA